MSLDAVTPSHLSYLMLILCGYLAIRLVYRYDLYEKEHSLMALIAVALGYGSALLVERTEGWIYNQLGERAGLIAVQAGVAASNEESAKLLIVVAIALIARRQFNDPLDGLVYGSLAGLGMAIEEALHFWRAGGANQLLIGEHLIRVFGHLVMGGIIGFPIGLIWARARGAFFMLPGSMLGAMSLHFLWDVIAEWQPPTPTWGRIRLGAAAATILGGMLFYGFLCEIGARHSYRVHGRGKRLSLLDWPFTLFLRRSADGASQRE
ncbi:MAG: PrsW family intramembrane metalloprotease [Phycisphaerales bacterium]|nr:PrsW family intramembrane metalloprotease [Phycisphaerales bacterium]